MREKKLAEDVEELLPIVDISGNVLGKEKRGICHNGSKILHPVVHLHVINNQGELYLQKRPSWKTIQPSKWDTAVGGHVSYGEDLLTSLKREVKEEIGISDFEPNFVTKYLFESDVEKELVNVFKTTYPGLIFPSEELSGGAFFSKQEILSYMNKSFFTPNFENEWNKLEIYKWLG